MRWALASTRRLYGTLVGVMVVGLVFSALIVGVRLVSTEPRTPRGEVTSTSTALEDVVRRAVDGKTRRIDVAAQDGLMTVVHVAMADGRLATVVLFSDGPTYVVDEVQWRSA